MGITQIMNYKRFIVGTDNHGELGCPKAIKKFLDFCDTWKPHYRIHLGDVWDFCALRGGAGAEEKSHGIAEDFNAGMQFLEDFRPHYLTMGNHDDRIWLQSTKMAEGILRERCEELANAAEQRLKQLRIKHVAYHVGKYLQLPEGGAKLIHGFRSSMYPAKAHYENWGACIHGHVHKPDEYTARHIDGAQAFSVGCLADLDKLTYADRTPSKLGWRQGFLYGYINTRTGKWRGYNVINEAGDWLSPMGVL